MIRKLIAGVMLMSLAACANMGTVGGEDRMSRAYVEKHLTVGKSTKADVQALYGTPGYKDEDSNKEDYWSYSEDQINPDYVSKALNFIPGLGMAGDAAAMSQARKTSRSLSFFFSSAGVIRSFSVSGKTGADR